MTMKRDTLITVLLVIAGIVLAIVLFGAGIWWKGKTVRRAGLQGPDILHVTSDRKGELI
jgi:hypothetical protein